MRKQLLFAAVVATASMLSLKQAEAQNTDPFWSLAGNSNATGASKLGTTNSTPLRLLTNDIEHMRIDPNGNIGIGLTSPIGKFSIRGSGGTPAGSWVISGSPIFTGFGESTVGNGDFILSMASNTVNARSVLLLRRARGTLAAPSAVNNDDFLGSLLSSGYDGSAFQNPATVDFYVDGIPSAGNVPARISFVTGSNSGNRAERLKIGNTGNFTFNDNQMFLNASNARLGIGTTAPERRLHVFNGSAGVFAVSNVNAPLVVENNTNGYINLLAPSANETGILFGNPGNAQDGGIIYLNSTDAMQFRTNGNTTRMTLLSDGDLDIAGGRLSFGSVEALADAGSNTISSNSHFVPTTNSTSSTSGRTLGNSSFKWREVWAFDGTINTSDERDKANVRELEYGMKEIMKLRATRFNWKADAGNNEKIGLIAQELKKVLPEVVRDWEYKQTTEDGPMEKVATERMGVLYADIIPVLIKGMQEQQLKIEELQREVERLKGGVTTYTGAGSLGQATPNPVQSSTRISYSLPSANSQAQLLLTDAAGKTVKAISLSGSGYIDLNTASLSSGTYNYSLMVDGKIVETKRITITR